MGLSSSRTTPSPLPAEAPKKAASDVTLFEARASSGARARKAALPPTIFSAPGQLNTVAAREEPPEVVAQQLQSPPTTEPEARRPAPAEPDAAETTAENKGQELPQQVPGLPPNWPYMIGVYQLDLQHKKLFDIIGSLRECKNHDYTGVEGIMSECLEYTRYHFETEERVLQIIGWADLESHKKEHAAFGNRVMETIYSIDFHNFPAIDDFGTFLNNWLVGHIMNRDKKFAVWLRSPENAPLVQRLENFGILVEPPKTAGAEDDLN